MKRWDEKLADLSTNLASLSQKAADASADAKTAREMRQEVINDRISTARGNVTAFQERVRIAGEEQKSKISSALLKVQMTAEERIRQRREKRDKKQYEKYIDEQISEIYDNFESASFLISKAQLAILETIEAIDEYNEKYGNTQEDAAEEMTSDAPGQAEETAEEDTPEQSEETEEDIPEQAEEAAEEKIPEQAEEAAEEDISKQSEE